MTHSRGAVMVESALVVSLILIFLYGSIQLGMVGLEQLTVDGGAFTAAHQKAIVGSNLNNYQDAPTLAKTTLPHLTSSDISVPDPTFGQPPTTETTNFVQQYNLNDPYARHGGVSMVQPVQTVSFVTSNNFASLLFNAANTISVTGIAIDPAFRLINGHGDVAGVDFNGATAFTTAVDPLVNGNNAPPYFVGFNEMTQCPYSYKPNAVPNWTTCPTQLIAALGLAEYLDVNNWGRPVNGVIPDRQAVFYEMRLHQNKFATIALDLSGKTLAQKAQVLDPLGQNSAYQDVSCVYSFDQINLGSYSTGTQTIGAYPVRPAGDPTLCSGP